MKKTILICDDDEGIVTMLKIFLATRGYITLPEQDSLNINTTIQHKNPDLVILDPWTPTISGYQVTKSLRQNEDTKSLPIIMISASPNGSNIALEAGANAYVSKLFDLDTLVRKIEGFL